MPETLTETMAYILVGYAVLLFAGTAYYIIKDKRKKRKS